MRLINDIIYKLPVLGKYNSSYYKIVDLLDYLKTINSETVEICTCSITPYYLEMKGTYEIYHHELFLALVNEPMFEKRINYFFGKHIDEIEPYFFKLHTTCYLESILPSKEVDVSNIIRWINYVIEKNKNDEGMKKMAKKHFNDDDLDINKLHFDVLIHDKQIYSVD